MSNDNHIMIDRRSSIRIDIGNVRLDVRMLSLLDGEYLVVSPLFVWSILKTF